MTIVYAKCTRRERLELWDNIKRLYVSDMPWMVGGDFNIITSITETQEGGPPNNNAIRDFNNYIMDVGLLDLGFVGLPFT